MLVRHARIIRTRMSDLLRRDVRMVGHNHARTGRVSQERAVLRVLIPASDLLLPIRIVHRIEHQAKVDLAMTMVNLVDALAHAERDVQPLRDYPFPKSIFPKA